MRHNEDDKYTREGDENSQVRNIINQLNSDKPSREKNREVVTRDDGTKVVRVTRKRKVMVSNAEKHRRSRRNVLYGVLASFLLVGLLVAFAAYRMSVICSESYLDETRQKIAAAWGASSVEIVNAKVEGMNLTADRVMAKFPESSVLERVELTHLSAPLDFSSLFTGEYRIDNLNVKKVDVRARVGVEKLAMPQWGTEETIWKIKNVNCEKFNFSVGDPATSPVVIQNASALMYATTGSGHVLNLSKGKLTIAGVGTELRASQRYDFNMLDGKMFFTAVSVEDIRINCQDPNSVVHEKEASRVDYVSSASVRELVTADFVLLGRIAEGESMYGPYELEIDRLPFNLITHGVYNNIFYAQVSSSLNENTPNIQMFISPEGKPAVFVGKLLLTDILFRDADLQAKNVFISHIVNANHNRKYLKLAFGQAWVELSQQNDSLTLTIQEGTMKETGTMDISIYGAITVGLTSENGQWNDLPLSGTLSYSLPRKVLNSEYKGGVIDPVFVADPKDDLRCVLNTELSGVALLPKDNAREQHEATQEIRSTLPKLEGMYDVDALPQILDTEKKSYTQPKEDENAIFHQGEKKEQTDDEFFGRKNENDIFTQPATVPVDPSVKF